MNDLPRRSGDAIAIAGDYQHRVTHHGLAPQRFWHQSRFRTSLEMLGATPGMRLLDIGCGSGLFAAQAAAQPDVQVVAIDANPRAIEFARKQFVRPNLQFRLGQLSELDFPERSFDRISLLEVIEHIYEHQAVELLHAVSRLLAPGGRLVISTPNARSAWPVIEWLLDRLRLVPRMRGDQHVMLYHPDSLRVACELAGFRLVDSRTLFVVSPAVAYLNWSLAQRLLEFEQHQTRGSLLLQAYER